MSGSNSRGLASWRDLYTPPQAQGRPGAAPSAPSMNTGAGSGGAGGGGGGLAAIGQGARDIYQGVQRWRHDGGAKTPQAPEQVAAGAKFAAPRYAGGGDVDDPNAAEPVPAKLDLPPAPSAGSEPAQPIAQPDEAKQAMVQKGGADGLYKPPPAEGRPGAAPSSQPALANQAIQGMRDIGEGAGKVGRGAMKAWKAFSGGGGGGGAAALMASGGLAAAAPHHGHAGIPALHSHGYGMVPGDSPGRADLVAARVRPGSYVVPADVVGGVGEGNSLAGAKAIMGRLRHAASGRPMGYAAGGVPGDDAIDVRLSGGEVVIPPEDVLELGQGDHVKGAQKLDGFISAVRRHVARVAQRMPPPR